MADHSTSFTAAVACTATDCADHMHLPIVSIPLVIVSQCLYLHLLCCLADLSGESFGGDTTSVLIGTGGGAVVDACPISVKPGGRGLSGGRHQMSCIIAMHQTFKCV